MIVNVILALAVGFTLSSMERVVTLANATISPNATRVAFVVSRVDREHNRYDDMLQIYNLKTGATASLGGSAQSIDHLAWSPDSSTLAMVGSEATDSVHQLYLVEPVSMQKRQLTRGKNSVSQIAWRPDGNAIAFRRQDDVPERHGADVYQDALRVGDNAYLDERQPPPAHIWVVSKNGVAQRLTQGSRNVMDSPLSWSSDGRYIIFETGTPTYSLADRLYAMRLNVASRQVSLATPYTKYVDQALYSPDGSSVAYLRARDGDLVNQVDAFVTSARGTRSRHISAKLDRYVTTLSWMPDSAGLLLQIDDRIQQPLVIQRLDGSVRRLPMGPVRTAVIQSRGSVARDGTIVFAGTEDKRPDELYVLFPHAAAPKRLTSYNDATAKLQLGDQKRIVWRSSDGYEEDGVLTYPPDYVPGRKYPLVVWLHGGPNESATSGFSDFNQLAANRGYIVFGPNYRGSIDLGSALVRAIYDDPNVGPSRDVLEGIAAVERLGSVDSSRIGVSGWSYGGMLTFWLETHVQTFKAAVSGAGVADLVVDYAIADDIDYSTIMFKSSITPFRGHALSLWREQSAISYADKARTPTLILCNIYDVRVPVVESYLMYRALRDNGVAVEFYAYPTTGHETAGPVRWTDAYQHWLGWFDRYLKQR